MKTIIIPIVFASVFILFIPLTVFAEISEVRILEGSLVPGCETTDSCLNPSIITINKGDTINWVREDDVHHPIISENSKGEQLFFTMDYTHTFNDIGTFDYFVTDMPWIKGTIIVEPVPVLKPYEIRDDATGGDCNNIGQWDSISKSCKIMHDLDGSIVIKSNSIELDGNAHFLDGNYDERTNYPSRCITVDAKLDVTIKNFNIKNCGIGISFQDVIESKIEDNTISDNFAGGIHMLSSNNNFISNNDILNNPNGGIAINGNENVIENNLIVDNSHQYFEKLEGVGLSINHMGSSGNKIIENSISGHKIGMNFDGVFEKNEVKNNKIHNNEIGIGSSSSYKFLIIGNQVFENDVGIKSYNPDPNGSKHSFIENTVFNNNIGFQIESAFNEITENSISTNSEYGLWLQPREQRKFDYENRIFNNNFIENSRQVWHGETNYFTVNNFGNYWSDFSQNCVDKNSDKVCDESYPFSSGTVKVIDTAVWKEKDGWLKSNTIQKKSEPQEPPKDTKIDGFTPSSESIATGKDIQKSIVSIAPFVDPTIDPQHYIDRYNNEPKYKEWFDTNFPEYDSIEQAVGLELNEKIPSWIKNIFGWYAQDMVSEDELLNAIKYLIEEKILIVN